MGVFLVIQEKIACLTLDFNQIISKSVCVCECVCVWVCVCVCVSVCVWYTIQVWQVDRQFELLYKVGEVETDKGQHCPPKRLAERSPMKKIQDKFGDFFYQQARLPDVKTVFSVH